MILFLISHYFLILKLLKGDKTEGSFGIVAHTICTYPISNFQVSSNLSMAKTFLILAMVVIIESIFKSKSKSTHQNHSR